ncbi:hypothetical protein RFI_33213, partial [Reticulomyxa filosa]
ENARKQPLLEFLNEITAVEEAKEKQRQATENPKGDPTAATTSKAVNQDCYWDWNADFIPLKMEKRKQQRQQKASMDNNNNNNNDNDDELISCETSPSLDPSDLNANNVITKHDTL